MFTKQVYLTVPPSTGGSEISLLSLVSTQDTLTPSETISSSDQLMQYKSEVNNEDLTTAYTTLSDSISSFNEEDLSVGQKYKISELLKNMCTDVKSYFGTDQLLKNKTRMAVLNMLSGNSST